MCPEQSAIARRALGAKAKAVEPPPGDLGTALRDGKKHNPCLIPLRTIYNAGAGWMAVRNYPQIGACPGIQLFQERPHGTRYS